MSDDPLAPFLEMRPEGLYTPAFDAFLDPGQPVSRAILSHAHSDHAVAGHAEVWATPETIALYRRRHPEWVGTARPRAGPACGWCPGWFAALPGGRCRAVGPCRSDGGRCGAAARPAPTPT